MSEPAVFGDPDAMRALAQELAARADLIGELPAGASATLDGATFEGGAAVRLRASATDARGRAGDVAAALRDVASALYADATTVEAQNAEAQAAAAAAASPDAGQPG